MSLYADVLAEAAPGALLAEKQKLGETYLVVEGSRVADVLLALRDDPRLGFDYFSECVGVDYADWPHERDLPNRFEVVYNLMSVATGARVFVKAGADDGGSLPTCKHVYLGAEYPEREIQDLFGVVFEGNGPIPGERFLLPDDWVGFPLRKDSPLGGEDVVFAHGTTGPAVEDVAAPHAGESFEGTTGTDDVTGRK